MRWAQAHVESCYRLLTIGIVGGGGFRCRCDGLRRGCGRGGLRCRWGRLRCGWGELRCRQDGLRRGRGGLRRGCGRGYLRRKRGCLRYRWRCLRRRRDVHDIISVAHRERLEAVEPEGAPAIDNACGIGAVRARRLGEGVRTKATFDSISASGKRQNRWLDAPLLHALRQ